MNQSAAVVPDDFRDAPEVKDLALFAAFYDHLTEGARSKNIVEALGVTKSALSRTIARLEKLLAPRGPKGQPGPGGRRRSVGAEEGSEAQLVTRATGASYGASKTGLRVHTEVSKFLRQYLDMLRRVRAVRKNINVAATDYLISFHLPELLGPFLREHPDVEINFVEAEWRDVPRLVRSGKIDCGVGPSTPLGMKCRREKLFGASYALIYPRSWGGVPGDFDGGHSLAFLEHRTVFLEQYADRRILKRLPQAARRCTLPNYSEMLAWVEQGLGAAFTAVIPQHRIDGRRVAQVELPALGKDPIYLYIAGGDDQDLAESAPLGAFVKSLVSAARTESR